MRLDEFMRSMRLFCIDSCTTMEENGQYLGRGQPKFSLFKHICDDCRRVICYKIYGFKYLT